MASPIVDPAVPTWCEYCRNVHPKGDHSRRKNTMPYWVSCSREVHELVAEYRHLLTPGSLTTFCGATASDSRVWRKSHVKPICPECFNRSDDYIV